MAGLQTSAADLAQAFARASDLKKRILFVLGALIVYRLGAHVPLPGIDAVALGHYAQQLQSGLFGLFNMFSGGAFSRMTIFALNIMPYITASIIVQLLQSIYPPFEELKKEGEQGRQRLNQYTRYFTVVLAMFQGFGMAIGLENATAVVAGQTVGLVLDPGFAFRLQTAVTLTTGTVFLMWLGEQINKRGVGNGISLLIFAGIVATLPGEIFKTLELARIGTLSSFFLIAVAILAVLIIGFVAFMETSQRRVPVQYPKRQVGMKVTQAQATHMPLKLNTSGVIPPIFASSLLLIPVTLVQFFPNIEIAQTIMANLTPGKWLYELLFVIGIIFFAFFYTALVFNPEETAENLKKQGGFVPGIRPGQATAAFFDYVLTRLTVVGAAYIAFVCVLPQVLYSQFNVPFQFGGTSLLIVVTVTIDTVSQIQSHLIAHRYEGLLRKSLLRTQRKKG